MMFLLVLVVQVTTWQICVSNSHPIDDIKFVLCDPFLELFRNMTMTGTFNFSTFCAVA